MRKGDALVCDGLTEAEATRVVVLLASMGIEPGVDQDDHGRMAVYVAPEDYDAAARLYAEESAARAAEAPGIERSDVSRDPFADPEVLAPRSWFGRGTSVVVGIMIACVAVFVAAHTGEQAGTRSRLLELGAISYANVESGEHWRLLSAVFLHFNIGHLLSNMGAIIVLAPPLAHQLAGWRFALVFVVTGIAGNAASHVIMPSVGLKAGASGAIAGVLGALGGQALRPGRRTRYKSWHILAALAAFYGLMIGFGPGRDNVAHVGGLLAGIVLGRLMEPPPDEAPPHGARTPPGPIRSS